MLFDNIGGSELFVVLLVVFIFFGPKKFPEMGKSIGKAVREFKNAMRGMKEDLEKSTTQREAAKTVNERFSFLNKKMS